MNLIRVALRSLCICSCVVSCASLAFAAPERNRPQPSAAKSTFIANELIVRLAEQSTAAELLSSPLFRQLRKHGIEIRVLPIFSPAQLRQYTAPHVRLHPRWLVKKYVSRQRRGFGINRDIVDRFAHYYQLRWSGTIEPRQLKQALQRLPAIAAVQSHANYQPLFEPNDTYWKQGKTSESAWSDEDSVDTMWGAKHIHAAQAWDLLDSTASISPPWDAVDTDPIVAVIDSGVAFGHPDLQQNMWNNAAEQKGVGGVDDDGNGYIDDYLGYDFGSSDGHPYDSLGHGTFVAGIIGATGHNNEGIVGIAPHARIMALKTQNNAGDFPGVAVAQAVQYATAMGADVINISLGYFNGGNSDELLHDAIRNAVNNGVVVVVAAGNETTDAAYLQPAAFKETIAVAASTTIDTLAPYSNSGWIVAVAAPGGNGVAGPGILSLELDGTYATGSGTSFAAPHVAGIAALLLSKYPALHVAQIRQALRLGGAQIQQPLGGEFFPKSQSFAGTLASWDPNPTYHRADALGALLAAPTVCAAAILKPDANALYGPTTLADGVPLPHTISVEMFIGPSLDNLPVTYSLTAHTQTTDTTIIAEGMVSEETVVTKQLTLPVSAGDGALTLELHTTMGTAPCGDDRTTIALSNYPAFIGLKDIQGNSAFGYAISATHQDLTADGALDIAVGAPAFVSPKELFDKKTTFAGTGAVHIISVQATDTLLTAFTLDSTAMGAITLKGEAVGDAAGFAVAADGDVDGDGIHDLLVSAPAHDCSAAQVDCGKVYLILGKTLQKKIADGEALSGQSVEQLATYRWTGPQQRMWVGYELAYVGDVDGDAHDDFVIGSREAHPDSIWGAESPAAIDDYTYLIVSNTMATWTEDMVIDSTAKLSFTDDKHTAFATSIRRYHSNNPANTMRGLARLDLNLPNGGSSSYPQYAGLTLDGTTVTKKNVFVSSVRPRHTLATGDCDLDGDGQSELLLQYYAPPDVAPSLFIVPGPQATQDGTVNVTALDRILLSYSGPAYSPACLGDINGDTMDDFFIPLHHESSAQRAMGFIYLGRKLPAYGVAGVFTIADSHLNLTDVLSFNGLNPEELLFDPYSAAAYATYTYNTGLLHAHAVGDLNMDGLDDFAVSFPFMLDANTSWQQPLASHGIVVLVYGKPLKPIDLSQMTVL